MSMQCADFAFNFFQPKGEKNKGNQKKQRSASMS